MKHVLFVTIFLFSVVGQAFQTSEEKKTEPQKNSNKMTTYYLIRHAEKMNTPGDRDPELSEAGIARAAAWADYFENVAFDDVYSTNYKRTIATATPTAKSKNLELKFYNPHKLYVEDFKLATQGKTVLVVGHSNTTPMLANAILAAETYPELDESEYAMLYIVRIDENGKVSSEAKKI